MSRRGHCADCGRLMLIRAKDRCYTCYWYVSHPDAEAHRAAWEGRRRPGPKPGEPAVFKDMFARVGPVPTRLQPHERAALAEVIRMTS